MRIIVNTALIALVFLAYALFATVGRAATSKTAPLALVVISEVIATLSERWHRASRHQHRISTATVSARRTRLKALPACCSATIVCCCCPIIFVSFGRMGLLYTPTLAGMGRRVIALKD